MNATLAGVSSVRASVLVARTANEWKPSARAAAGWNGLAHATQSRPSIWHSKLEPSAFEVKEKIGRVFVVDVPGHSVIVVSGATGAGGGGGGVGAGGGVGRLAVNAPLTRVVPLRPP